MFHIFGALAEFERSIIRERTTAGLASAPFGPQMNESRRALPPNRPPERLSHSSDLIIKNVMRLTRDLSCRKAHRPFSSA